MGGDHASLRRNGKKRDSPSLRRNVPIIDVLMAIMHATPLLPAATGKLGNVVLVTNRDGSIVLRERVVPRNPRTPGQTRARGNLGTTAQLWARLTDDDRARRLPGLRGGSPPSGGA